MIAAYLAISTVCYVTVIAFRSSSSLSLSLSLTAIFHVDLVLECLHSGFYWSYSKFSTSPRSGEVQLLAVSAVEATKFSSLHTAKIL